MTTNTGLKLNVLLKNSKLPPAILGIIVAVWISLSTPPAGLTVEAMKALGIMAWAVVYWMWDILPEYVVSLLMCASWVIFKVVKFNVAFATFSSDSWWILVGAMGIGAAATKSGLLKRISLVLLDIFPATFRGQVLAMLGAGMLISPLIPSVTAKSAIVAPLGLAVSDAMGFQRKSQGAGGLFAAMGTGFISTAPMYISGSFIGYMIIGLLPQSMRETFTWTYWLQCGITWGIFMLAVMAFAILVLYKPKEDVAMPAGFVASELKKLGTISAKEKITLITLVSTLLLWMTEKIHGIPASMAALTALCVLLAAQVFDREDFRKLIVWDAVFNLGAIIGLGSVIPALKIDKWIGQVLGPILTPFVANIAIFAVCLSITVYLVRFILVSQTSTVAVMIIVFLPLAIQHNINPWIVAFIIYCASNVWNTFYQSPAWLAGYYATGGEMVTHRQMIKLSVSYMIVSVLGILISIPVWRFMGLL